MDGDRKINGELFPGLQSVSVVWFSLSIDDTSVTSRNWGRIQCNNGDLRNAGFTGGVRKCIVLCIHYSHTKQHSVRAETCDGEAPWQTQCQQSECDNVPLKSCRLCRESHLWPCWSDEKGSQNVPLIFSRRNMINQTAKTGTANSARCHGKPQQDWAAGVCVCVLICVCTRAIKIMPISARILSSWSLLSLC